MIRSLFFIAFFSFCFVSNAQYSSAYVFSDQLARAAMPNYDEELQRFQRYQDSLTKVITDDPKFKQMEADMKNVDENDEASVQRFIAARDKMNQTSDRMKRILGGEYQKRFQKALSVYEQLKAYQSEADIDVIFVMGKEGLQNIEYITPDKQSELDGLVMKCADIPKDASNEEKSKLYNERLPACRDKVLSPLYESASDVTSQVISKI